MDSWCLWINVRNSEFHSKKDYNMSWPRTNTEWWQDRKCDDWDEMMRMQWFLEDLKNQWRDARMCPVRCQRNPPFLYPPKHKRGELKTTLPRSVTKMSWTDKNAFHSITSFISFSWFATFHDTIFLSWSNEASGTANRNLSESMAQFLREAYLFLVFLS